MFLMDSMFKKSFLDVLYCFLYFFNTILDVPDIVIKVPNGIFDGLFGVLDVRDGVDYVHPAALSCIHLWMIIKNQ